MGLLDPLATRCGWYWFLDELMAGGVNWITTSGKRNDFGREMSSVLLPMFRRRIHDLFGFDATMMAEDSTTTKLVLKWS